MAELTLLGTARAVRVVLRAAESNVAIKVRKRFERANLELGRLPTARSSADLREKIQALLHARTVSEGLDAGSGTRR